MELIEKSLIKALFTKTWAELGKKPTEVGLAMKRRRSWGEVTTSRPEGARGRDYCRRWPPERREAQPTSPREEPGDVGTVFIIPLSL